MQPRLPCGHFYGKILHSRTVAGFILTETVHAPRSRMPRHSHVNAYFCLVRAGAYTEVYGSRTRACGPLTLAFHPAGELHSEQVHDGEVRSFNIEVGPAWPERLRGVAGRLDRACDLQGTRLAPLALRLYREFCEPDALSPLAIEGLALELLAEAARHQLDAGTRRPPRWLEQARELIHARFAESLSLSQVAEAVGVHPVYLAGTFRRQFRQTVGGYVRQLRVEFATRELATTDAPLAVIALAAGFADQSHFTRTFKRLTAMTPAAYRKSVRRA